MFYFKLKGIQHCYQHTIFAYPSDLIQFPTNFQGIEFAEQSEKYEEDSEAGIASIREEMEILQNTLREMANCVIEESDNTATILGEFAGNRGNPSKVDMTSMEYDDEDTFNDGDVMDDFSSFNSANASSLISRNKQQGRRSTSPSRMARMRSMSPVRARSPAFADSAVSMAQSALKKRHLQIQVSYVTSPFHPVCN